MEENPLGLAYLRDRNSILHRMDPVSKGIWLMAVSILSLFIITDYTHLIINIIITILVVSLSKVKFKEFMKPLLILLPVWIPFLVVTPVAFTFQAPIIGLPPEDRYWFNFFNIIDIPYSATGWRYGTSIFLRGVTVCIASLMLIWTTHPKDLVYSLTEQLRIPYRISWGLFLALVYTPLVSYEATVVDYAHKIRGVKYKRYPGAKALKKVFPIMIRSLRRGGVTAIAMDGRAFAAQPKRTFRDPPPKSRASKPFAIGTIIICILYTIFFFRGLNQFLPWG